MIINNYFINNPTKISVIDLGISKSYKKELIETAYSLGDNQNQTTNVQAIMSHWKVWELTDKFNKFLNIIHQILNQLEINTDPNYKLYLIDCWTAIYKKNHYTLAHNHLPCHYSFVYYLQSPNPPTPIIFDKCDYEILPQEDNLIVFPSYLSHKVPKHNHKQDRICVAGNVGLTSID